MENENIQETTKEEYIDNMITNIIENKLRSLLEIINKCYPIKFKKELINNEIQYIMKHINFKSYVTQAQIQIKPPQQSSLQLPKYIKLKHKNTSSIQIPPSKNNKILDINRCSARVWNADILDRNTLIKLTDLPDCFKVIDFKDIDIKKFNTNYILGSHCKNKKYQNNEYCKLHTNHLIHGNYNSIPSKEICYHFMKGGNYL